MQLFAGLCKAYKCVHACARRAKCAIKKNYFSFAQSHVRRENYSKLHDFVKQVSVEFAALKGMIAIAIRISIKTAERAVRRVAA